MTLKAKHGNKGSLSGVIGNRKAPAVVPCSVLTVDRKIPTLECLLDEIGKLSLSHRHIGIKGKAQLPKNIGHIKGAAAHNGFLKFAFDISARVRHLVNT